ncbi:MAG: hypothetical protein J6O50_07480 [Ruminiclostridium sp.]|nr:hypothetical protein [Ruminiclostridium sp.]
MKTNVSVESLKGPVGEFILASVTSSDSIIGICDTSVKSGITRKTLYAGSESLVNMQYREKNNESNRVIWQTSSIDKAKTILGSRLSKSCENYFSGSAPLSKAVMPVLELLPNGLYVVHIGKVYPTDGAGNFFWDAFTVKHEIMGSAPYNALISSDKCFSPPFIVPTQSFAGYTEAAVGAAAEKLVSGKKLGGIAFHLSGMFSALLEGHINAAACAANNYDFNCIIIEPLNRVIYGDPGSIDENQIVALSCPYVKISFNDISRKMLENFLINRSVSIPRDYDEIKWKADKMLSNGVLSRKISPSIDKNIEGYPDAEMMASALAINELTDNDLSILLSGSTTDEEGNVIISQNYYESITYAINYLQLRDKRRFIDFAGAIIKNPDLSAAYGYVTNRLKYIMDAKVNEIFKFISETEDKNYNALKPVAEKYAQMYGDYTEGNVKRFLNNSPTSSGSSGNSLAGLGGLTGGRSAADALLDFAAERRNNTQSAAPASAPASQETLSSLELSKQVNK